MVDGGRIAHQIVLFKLQQLLGLLDFVEISCMHAVWYTMCAQGQFMIKAENN